ncbi:MAG: hypothetical protein O7E52_20215 [Candidatus Poribacteria bacterium]|nr:hypothetical protein [Candidatus Poribacteria bacterium]
MLNKQGLRKSMLEAYRHTIAELREAFVEVCKTVFGESLVSILTKGSTVKGGFIPGLSDVDLHVYLKDDAFIYSDFLKLELGLSLQEKMYELIRNYDLGGGPIQVICLPVSHQRDWVGPLPETYILLYGDACPDPPPTAEEMLKQDLDSLKNPTYAYKLINSLSDERTDQLASYVRRLNPAVTPALYRVLSLLTQHPFAVWTMTKFEVLGALEKLEDERARQLAEFGRTFYDLASKRDELREDADLCRTAIRVGFQVVDLGREIGHKLDK